MKIIGKYISFILIASIFQLSEMNASPQLSDYIVFEGDTSSCYNLLVESYLNQQNVKDEDKLFNLSFRNGASLNCWRGYQAIYTIEKNELYLTAIINCGELLNGNTINEEASKNRMTELFSEKVIGNRVKVNWYNGLVSIPKGKTLRWDGVFYKIHMNEILLSIDHGQVIKIEKATNYVDNPNGIDRLHRDSLSSILFKEVLKQKWKSKYDCSERFNITINSKGIVDNIVMIDYQTQTEIEEAWDMKEYKYCIKKLKTAFKNLKFDIIKDKGIPIDEEVYIEIWFEDDGTIENWTY